MKNGLTVEQMINALFLLCSEIVLLRTRNVYYYYLKPQTKSNVYAIKYIFRKNGMNSYRHRSRFYYSDDNLVVRVPLYEFENCTNPQFGLKFRQSYNQFMKYSSFNKKDTVDNSFWLKTRANKEKILKNMLENSK
ncbi:MAG: hypothetical protein ACLRFI_02660 [Alphaproteobacteria bacterium]